MPLSMILVLDLSLLFPSFARAGDPYNELRLQRVTQGGAL
jgi:hypothetical protein